MKKKPYNLRKSKELWESLVRRICEDTPDKDGHEGNSSLDNQVDKFLSEYETEAKNTKKEGMDFRSMVRRALREAGDDEEEQHAEKPGDDDKQDDVAKDEPEKLSADDLDMSTFVNSVIRLVDNYDSLLEVKNTILRRARNFIAKNYNPEAAESFDESLKEEHGMDIGESSFDHAEDDFQAPSAGAAGPLGGGGGSPA